MSFPCYSSLLFSSQCVFMSPSFPFPLWVPKIELSSYTINRLSLCVSCVAPASFTHLQTQTWKPKNILKVNPTMMHVKIGYTAANLSFSLAFPRLC